MMIIIIIDTTVTVAVTVIIIIVIIIIVLIIMIRNVLGTMNLGDILSQRESIAREMQVLSSDDNHDQLDRDKDKEHF